MNAKDNPSARAARDVPAPAPQPAAAPAARRDGPQHGRRRAVIDAVLPAVDRGRFAVKRCVGDTMEVFADAFVEGHEQLRVRLAHRRRGEPDWLELDMTPMGNDRWRGAFPLVELGVHEYTVVAWPDAWRSWRHDFARRTDEADVALALETGARLVAAAARRVRGGAEAKRLKAFAERLAGAAPLAERRALAADEALDGLMTTYADRRHETRFDAVLQVVADPVRARFSAWYELFPRSVRGDGTHGTLADVEARLPEIAALGFDVLYLPPIHPIGRVKRKGPNNALVAGPDDPGSPWAIGAEEGGHTAVHPQLGTVDDVARLAASARSHGIELALDVAFQCAPDHPWVREHPDWFRKRPDGSVQYAENPPKKYEDIYPFDFDCEDWQNLWLALEGVFRFWIAQGVRVFRVDNPHTKPFPMWEWMIGRLKAEHPELVFLSEAFTRPKVMHRLAKLGYTQSYTYFAWRDTKEELTEYFTELAHGEGRDYFRPNVWPNTPDILTETLQHGGRPAFVARLVLAATLSASYGVYGPAYELLEHRPRHAGSEEYLDSEKYQIRRWPVERTEDNLRPLMARLNAIRREHPALQSDRRLAFHAVDNPQLIAYSKSTPALDDVVLVVASLDWHWRQAGWTSLDLGALGLDADASFEVHDLLTGRRFRWHGAHNYVELDPSLPAHVLHVVRAADEAAALDERFA